MKPSTDEDIVPVLIHYDRITRYEHSGKWVRRLLNNGIGLLNQFST